MYDEVMDNLKRQLPREELKRFNQGIHLGIFSEPYLTYMLEGKKTIESRFSKKRILPYNNIKKGDIVLVKKSSGKVLAYFRVKEALFFDLTKTSIEDIKDRYEGPLCVSNDFWKMKEDSKYATLIMIDDLVNIEPFSINKKGMQTWIKLK